MRTNRVFCEPTAKTLFEHKPVANLDSMVARITNFTLSIVVLSLMMGGERLLKAEETTELALPRNLLKLVHAAEVQSELGLDDDHAERFTKLLAELDKKWWPSRIQPAAMQLKIVAELESRLNAELATWLSADRLQRLREIEIQSLGTRALVRPDISQKIGLSTKQLQTLQTIFSETDGLVKQVNESRSKDAGLEMKLKEAQEAELSKVRTTVTPLQAKTLGQLIGKPFDTAKLKRIYPLAPELIDSGEWAGGAETSLAKHRGRVVLVHFYAFQCHNCVANFPHYTRWHDKLAARGVSVIGIQTPETSAEGNAAMVRRAADERGFEFPVLIDLEKRNWDAWGNTMWPTVYVIDQKGYIRFWWQGELNWQGATVDKTIETLVDELLVEQ
jgi:peroxiredoxin